MTLIPADSLVVRLTRLTVAASLTLSALLYFLWSWRWPLVGDASLIHYIAFLIERGWAPYRDLGDMNMPGSYLIELAAMRLFGPGPLAWRLFDFTLLAAATAAFFSILGRRNWLAPLFASSLFLLIHGRDGLAQGGQRDLTMAVLLLAATAFLLAAIRSAHNQSAYAAAFGLLSGIALTIKPTVAPLSLAQLALAIYTQRKLNRPWRTNALSAILAATIAPTIALVFLLREHALGAFLDGFHGIVPYYASLGHRTLGYILLHSLSPILSLVILWLAILALRRPPLDPTRGVLILGVLFGLINCIVQARALPYYRYPLLAFLLPLIAIDLTSAAQTGLTGTLRTKSAAVLALAALAVGALFLAPQSAILIHRYRWYQTDFNDALERDLATLGGPALSHHIQCIDSVSGCNTVLYDLRLEPVTGVLSDFLLFGNTTDAQPPESIPIVRDTRAQFTRALDAHPPQVIVVTSHLHLSGPDNYAKLDRWPAFAAWLAANYTLSTEWSPSRTTRWWSREEPPAGYRIYTLRDAHPAAHNREPIKARPNSLATRNSLQIHMLAAYLEAMRMTVLASGSKGNSTVIASANTRVLVDAGLSCRELLKRLRDANEDPAALDAILITHEHQDHIAGLATLARRLRIPVFLTEPTHRAWVRMVTPRTNMTYAQWLDRLAQEKAEKERAACAPSMTVSSPQEPCAPCLDSETLVRSAPESDAVSGPHSDEEDFPKLDPAHLPAVQYFHSGTAFSIGDISVTPFTIPHDAADPCGFVFESRTEAVRMAIATDLGYFPPNVKAALKRVDVLLLESNHDLEMLKDGPYPWSVKQRVLSRVGHLSNHATAEFLARDYDGGATYIVLGHLSEANNAPELARLSAEQALGNRMSLLGNRILLAQQTAPLAPICL